MGARRNFRRGGGKPKKAPHKTKKGTCHGEKLAKITPLWFTW